MQAMQSSPPMSLEAMQRGAINLVELFCAVITRPVELMLRPWHGTRYFPPTIMFLSSILMLVIPAFSAMATGVERMIPFSHVGRPVGMFGMADFAELYFLLSFVHGIRLYRRMIQMEREQQSGYEGPSLPFFRFIPWARSFWLTRIVIEPVLLYITASLLQGIYIIQPGLCMFLHFSALMLVFRNFISWYRCWEQLRDILDSRNAGPLIAKMVEERATQEDLAQIHLASFPKGVSPDVRRSAIQFIARAYEVPIQEGEPHATHR